MERHWDTSKPGRMDAVINKPKFQPLNLLVLVISAITMSMLAYKNFNQGQTGYGITFVIFCVGLLGMAVYGWKENRRQKNRAS